MESNDRKQEPRQDSPKREGKKDSVRLLTVIQIVGCLVVLGAAVLLRTFGGTVYDTVRDWYLEAVGDSIVTDDQVSEVKRVIVGLWPSSSSAQSSGVSSAPRQASSGTEKGAASQAPSSAQSGASAVSPVSSAVAASK